MKLLFCGDVMGQAGRKAVATHVPKLREKYALDAVIMNGENAAHGLGLTPKTYKDLIRAGADVITMGNHTFDKMDIVKIWAVLDKFFAKLDLVLIMSVEPGFGGQSFIDSALDKIRYCRKKIDGGNLPCLIEVDGGINKETAKLCRDAGVDVLVAGSYLFGHEDIKERLEGLRE